MIPVVFEKSGPEMAMKSFQNDHPHKLQLLFCHLSPHMTAFSTFQSCWIIVTAKLQALDHRNKPGNLTKVRFQSWNGFSADSIFGGPKRWTRSTTLPETNIVSEDRPSQKELIIFFCGFSGYISCREGRLISSAG